MPSTEHDVSLAISVYHLACYHSDWAFCSFQVSWSVALRGMASVLGGKRLDLLLIASNWCLCNCCWEESEVSTASLEFFSPFFHSPRWHDYHHTALVAFFGTLLCVYLFIFVHFDGHKGFFFLESDIIIIPDALGECFWLFPALLWGDLSSRHNRLLVSRITTPPYCQSGGVKGSGRKGWVGVIMASGV